MNPQLSIIMPVYNERETVLKVIHQVMELPVEKELIIVDDFSTDGTRELLGEHIPEGKIPDDRCPSPLSLPPAHPACHCDPVLNTGEAISVNPPTPFIKGNGDLKRAGRFASSSMKVLFHKENKGKGAAIRTALKEVTGDCTIIQDADMEYDPGDFLTLLQPVLKGEAEVVYGSRFMGGYRNLLSLHWWGNKILTTTTNLLYRSHLSDMETCYKLFRTDILKSINLCANRFDFEPEITAKLLRREIKILELPIKYKGRKFTEGKKITWRDGFSALWTLIKHRFS